MSPRDNIIKTGSGESRSAGPDPVRSVSLPALNTSFGWKFRWIRGSHRYSHPETNICLGDLQSR